MKKKGLFVTAAVLALSFALTGCGSSSNKEKVNYKDGTYTGQSEVYDTGDEDAAGNGYGVVTITIKDNVITDCDYKTYEPDGTLKAEDYGKEGGEVANRDYYNKAQKAVAACNEYASELIASGSIDDIDAISGATINYNEFKEAVKNALEQAEISE